MNRSDERRKWMIRLGHGLEPHGKAVPALFLLIVTGIGLFLRVPGSLAQSTLKGKTAAMQITSPAFANAETIPDRFTCKGADVSPAVAWEGLPAGTISLALIFDDPDAPMGTWVHWVAYDIPAGRKGLPENVPGGRNEIAGGGLQGTNSWGRIGYGGPCPPSGTHRYYFRLYALDRMLELKPGATKSQVTAALEGHVLGEAELMGRYSRH